MRACQSCLGQSIRKASASSFETASARICYLVNLRILMILPSSWSAGLTGDARILLALGGEGDQLVVFWTRLRLISVCASSAYRHCH